MVIKIVDQVGDGELLESAWDLYEDAFRELNALAVQRHLMYRSEFDDVMRDTRVQKYLCVDDDSSLSGLATYTNDLRAVPLIAPEYFARRWPELYRQRKIWYCGFVAVTPGGRGNRSFAQLVEAMYTDAADHNGIIGLDLCQFNAERRNMSRVIRIMLDRLSGAVRAERMDQQSYWIYEFPSAA
jgi:hypothetical protein